MKCPNCGYSPMLIRQKSWSFNSSATQDNELHCLSCHARYEISVGVEIQRSGESILDFLQRTGKLVV